jgi:hypothetical protein
MAAPSVRRHSKTLTEYNWSTLVLKNRGNQKVADRPASKTNRAIPDCMKKVVLRDRLIS